MEGSNNCCTVRERNNQAAGDAYLTYLFLIGSDFDAGAALVVETVERRLVELSLFSRLRTVLTRERTLPKPFFSFSSLGTEGPA